MSLEFELSRRSIRFSSACGASSPLLRRGGAIVLNASIGAQTSSSMAYGASKAGVRLLGRSLAAELLPSGIRVNTVSAGPIDTPIYGRSDGVPDDILHHFAAKTPMKRVGTPEEVANAVAFLAKRAAFYRTCSGQI